MVLLWEKDFSGWGHLCLQSFCRSTRVYVKTLLALPLMIWFIFCKSFAKILPISYPPAMTSDYIRYEWSLIGACLLKHCWCMILKPTSNKWMDSLIRNFKSNYADRSFLAEFQCPFWLWRSLEASLSDDEKSLKNFHSKVIRRRRPRCARRAAAAA